MNSSACYRNGTQNGDGDGVGQCEHTIKVHSLVTSAFVLFFDLCRPVLENAKVEL